MLTKTGPKAPSRETAFTEGPFSGPVQGPFTGATPGTTEYDEDFIAPASPHTMNRTMIQNLTMPPLPQLSIPNSPPGSPPRAINAKFKKFLDLKEKGVHFNENLSKSNAVKNPSLLPKLLGFAGLEVMDQYATTLPLEIWNPSSFPPWAFKDDLLKSQQEMTKQKEKERKETGGLDFVPASTPVSGKSSRAVTPVLKSGAGKGSAAERVRAGLNRDRLSADSSATVSRDASRSGLGYRKGKEDSRRRSRSPARR
jgi:hypothetical protein